jgi:hypothetical protein
MMPTAGLDHDRWREGLMAYSQRNGAVLAPLLALPCALLLAGAARGQNLVVNGDFATDVAGWSTAYHGPVISIAWSPLDAAGSTQSGSVEVTSTDASGGSGGPTQCVDLPDAAVVLRMDILVPVQSSFPDLYADPYVRWYDGPGCSGSEISTEFPIGSVSAGQGWTQIGGPLSPPLSAQAVLIDLGLVKPAGNALPAVAYFDDVYLPEPAAPALGACALAALLSLRSLRRSDRTRRDALAPDLRNAECERYDR